MASKQITLDVAARLIPDQATVTVSSSSGLGCPDATLRAIGERFAREGSLQKLTMIHPIAAGDMYGIAGRPTVQTRLAEADRRRQLSQWTIGDGRAHDLVHGQQRRN